MKYLVVVYIKSHHTLFSIESVLDYHKFEVIESNDNYRVFTGQFRGNARSLADRLNMELESIEFHIEDSMFIVYPLILSDGHPSLANFIIKRKGNKFLRNKFNR